MSNKRKKMESGEGKQTNRTLEPKYIKTDYTDVFPLPRDIVQFSSG